MNVLYPGIGQAKQYRNTLIDWLSSFLPEGNLPPPPGMSNQMLMEPGTWQGAGNRLMNYMIPQPEDTIMGFAEPRVLSVPYFNEQLGKPMLHIGVARTDTPADAFKLVRQVYNDMLANKAEGVTFQPLSQN